MAKKFSTKKYRLRSRAEKRRFNLKVAPKTFGVKTSVEQANLEVLRKIESKVKAIEASKVTA
ncbi:MAG: hypothetical protein MRZ79_10060 [Bacteroidia bacterium]|nr:hypothetical protein [Bacteroidia bacterium]